MTDSKKALFLFLLFYTGFFFVSGYFRQALSVAVVLLLGRKYFCNIEKQLLQYFLSAVGGMAIYFIASRIVAVLSLPGGYEAANFDFNAIFFLDVLILTPLAEELLFRSCLNDVLAEKFSYFFIPLSVLLFAAVHLSQGIGGAFFAAVCGIGLSFTYKMKKKIIFSVIMHSFINLGGCLDCIF